jgi:hypothetical protein
MNFVWFFLTVYLTASLIVYSLHGGTIFEENELNFSSFKNAIGDFAVRGAYIVMIYWTSGHLVATW